MGERKKSGLLKNCESPEEIFCRCLPDTDWIVPIIVGDPTNIL